MPGPIIRYKRTRFAPTPSGFLHLGNVLSFAITATLARDSGAKIILRIDDLDQARVNKPFMLDIFDTLNFLDIPWDEGPCSVKDFEDNYSQLHRMDMYREALKQLADEGLVFACTCSRSQLGNDTCDCINRQISLSLENVSWRLKTPANKNIEVKNLNGNVVTAALPDEMKNFVVKKKDGFPAYQLTSVIDDLFYDADLVVRGEDLWPSTLAQQELSLALKKDGFRDITFYHHPLLTEPAGQKLSKSAGATSVQYLLQSGKTATDVYKLIALMLGVKENIGSWQQLAGLVINRNGFIK